MAFSPRTLRLQTLALDLLLTFQRGAVGDRDDVVRALKAMAPADAVMTALYMCVVAGDSDPDELFRFVDDLLNALEARLTDNGGTQTHATTTT